MITGQVLSWWASSVAWLGGLLQLPAPPAFLGQLAGYVTTASSYVAGTGSWMPWTLLATVIGVWAACLVAALVIKGVRIVLSFVTLGGGSAS